MICLTGARFTMNAEILRQIGDNTSEHSPIGEWVTEQNPITGNVKNVWVPGPAPLPNSPVLSAPVTIPCLARGIVDGGIRVAGTTERFGDTYENLEYIKLWTPANVRVTKRDRITNIRDKKNGRIVWIDEEYEGGERPTVFNVNGVTPLFDAFNKHTENFILLERAEHYGTTSS